MSSLLDAKPRFWPNRPLFGPESATIDDMLVLVMASREALSGSDPERLIWDAWRFLDGSVRFAFEQYQGGAVPLEVVEVTACLTALSRPKDYGSHPVWTVAWELGAFAPSQDKELAASMIDEAAIEGQLEGEKDEAAREGKRRGMLDVMKWRAGLYGALPRRVRPPTREETEVCARIAPLGLGGSFRVDVQESRPLLYRNRKYGPAWEGLCSAFDAIGAASFAGLDRLGAIADGAESPALLWLDEIACRLAREEGRAIRRAGELDELLAGGKLGPNAAELASVVKLGRKQFAKEQEPWHDAWLRLAASTCVTLPRTEEEVAEEEETRAVLRREGRPGRPFSHIMQALQAQLDALDEIARLEEEEWGPFYEKTEAPAEVLSIISGVLHYAVLGFRQLYGLELLCSALPRLTHALGEGERLGPRN